MCEKAYLLDGIGYVREGEGEVLQSTDQSMVVCCVRNQRTKLSQKFGAIIGGNGGGFANEHVGTS